MGVKTIFTATTTEQKIPLEKQTTKNDPDTEEFSGHLQKTHHKYPDPKCTKIMKMKITFKYSSGKFYEPKRKAEIKIKMELKNAKTEHVHLLVVCKYSNILSTLGASEN